MEHQDPRETDRTRFVDFLRTLTRGGVVEATSVEDEVDQIAGTEEALDLAELREVVGVGDLHEIYRRLVEADISESLRELEMPHFVVCFDPQTGYFTVEGPFDDGLAASRMAEEDALADEMVGSGFRYLVLPLLPRRDRP